MRFAPAGQLLEEYPLVTEAGIGAWLGAPHTARLYVQEKVYDEATGRLAASVSLVDLPYQARIPAVSPEELAVLARGPMDEEYVVRYRRSGP